MSHRLPVALCGFSAVGLLAFALVTRGEESNAVPIASKNPAIDPARDPFAAIMLKAAEEYVTWGRYNNQLRWAPALCAAPSPTSQIISPEFSDSGDKTTHGGKLYSLFVKDRLSYLKVTMDKSVPQNTTAGGTSSSDNRTGQIIVKESWTTKPIENLQVDAQGMPPSIAEGTHHLGAFRGEELEPHLDPQDLVPQSPIEIQGRGRIG
jgi:hypothetical protein